MTDRGRRYSVVMSYRGDLCRGGSSTAGIFNHLGQAIKQRDRQNASDPLVVKEAADLLRIGPHYRWRVYDLGARRFAD